MKKAINAFCASVCVVAIAMILFGCKSLDKVDIPVEISVVGTDGAGNEYNVTLGPDGAAGEIRAALDGALYELSEDGVSVTLPDGEKIKIRLVE